MFVLFCKPIVSGDAVLESAFLTIFPTVTDWRWSGFLKLGRNHSLPSLVLSGSLWIKTSASLVTSVPLSTCACHWLRAAVWCYFYSPPDHSPVECETTGPLPRLYVGPDPLPYTTRRRRRITWGCNVEKKGAVWADILAQVLIPRPEWHLIEIITAASLPPVSCTSSTSHFSGWFYSLPDILLGVWIYCRWRSNAET